jgi:hypothetical protein
LFTESVSERKKGNTWRNHKREKKTSKKNSSLSFFESFPCFFFVGGFSKKETVDQMEIQEKKVQGSI